MLGQHLTQPDIAIQGNQHRHWSHSWLPAGPCSRQSPDQLTVPSRKPVATCKVSEAGPQARNRCCTLTMGTGVHFDSNLDGRPAKLV